MADKGKEYGWASILSGGAGFFFIPFIPLFSILALVFGFLAIVNKAKMLGYIGMLLGILSMIYIYGF